MIDLMNKIIDGDAKALNHYAEVKEYFEDIKNLFDAVKEIAEEEAESYEKNFSINGNDFEKRNGRKVWNFKNISEWQIAKDNLKEIEDKYKIAFSAYQKGKSIIDDGTGEVLPVPDVTYTKDYFVFKRKKSK